MRKALSGMLYCVLALSSAPAFSQAGREATIEPETKARLVLQSHLSSKLNEPGDSVSATLEEPVYVNGEMVLPRGVEFRGRVTQTGKAGKAQKNGRLAIVFEHILMPWGEVEAPVAITAIDDWSSDQKLKANDEGKVNGSRSGRRTADNVETGAVIGTYGAISTVLLGGPDEAAGGGIAGAMLGALLLTKGGDVRVSPGAIFRMKFVKPVTLPVIQPAGSSPRTNQPSNSESKEPAKKPS
ncbi:MAG TPA: hypothetical protein VFB82_00075 [Blastocatellia bacterium]|jgi:hypothetical protein|nr:hypothetical protein [Blastocatellia bacterium]